VVGEFPELQGVMGKYYASAQGEDASVAAACEEHYKPLGPADAVPTNPVSVAVALADKIDTLVGFWAIDEKPTGSKDPYALRRAALGLVRLILANELRIPLTKELSMAGIGVAQSFGYQSAVRLIPAIREIAQIKNAQIAKLIVELLRRDEGVSAEADKASEIISRSIFDVLLFLADRLKVQLREQGAHHDLVDAVFALERQDDLVLIARRVEALGKLLDTEDGKNLLAGYKRATNIIRIEEKKDARKYVGKPDPALYRQDEERALAKAIDVAKQEAAAAVAEEDFEAAMRAMAQLRPHVDTFFDKVTVNVEDGPLRENRLKLLNEIREATRTVADFSRIEG